MVNHPVNLRHTTGSFLSATGAYPKTAQAIMWHSDINLDLGVYTHSYREDEAVAVNKLPGVSHDPQRQRATGTVDAHADVKELADTADSKSAGPSRQPRSDQSLTSTYADDLALRLAQLTALPTPTCNTSSPPGRTCPTL